MRAYIITEEQKQALLNELALEKFQESQFIKPEMSEQERHMRETVHRAFHCIVCRHLEK